MTDDTKTVDDNLLILRNTVGDLRRGFSRSVDSARWVADTQAFIDEIRVQVAAVRAEVHANCAQSWCGSPLCPHYDGDREKR